MILLHVGGASATSVLATVVVIFFLIFAVSFAFGKIPEGQHRFGRAWAAAWFRASLPRLLIAAAFSAALFGGSSLFGGGQTTSSAATCDRGQAPRTGEWVTAERLASAIDGMQRIANAAAEDQVSQAQTLFYTLDAHNVTHDIDAPLRSVDATLARDLCLSVIVLENQIAGPLEAAVIARESEALAGYLRAAREILPSTDEILGIGEGTEPCSQPVGAVSDQRLTAARIEDAAGVLRQIADEAATGDVAALQIAFFGDAHNITHDIDGPLRAEDEQVAIGLCMSILEVEVQLGRPGPDLEIVATEAANAAELLEAGGQSLGILE